jgi:glycerol kinase
VRAALESAAYQTADVLAAMPPTALLRVDGGMTRNRWLVQFLADVLQIPVETAREPEQTALGAALIGLGVRTATPAGGRFEPLRDLSALYAGWQEALCGLVLAPT